MGVVDDDDVVVVVVVALGGSPGLMSFISSSSFSARAFSTAAATVAEVVVGVGVVDVAVEVAMGLILARIEAPPPMGGIEGCSGCSLALATPMVCSRSDCRVTWSCMRGSQTTGTEGWFHGHWRDRAWQRRAGQR